MYWNTRYILVEVYIDAFCAAFGSIYKNVKSTYILT